MIDYSLIIAILAFFAAVQLAIKQNTPPLLSSLVAVGVPVIVSSVLKLINLLGWQLPILENIISLQLIVTVAIQFAISFVVFKRLRDEDGYEALLVWGVGGVIAVCFATPLIVAKLITF